MQFFEFLPGYAAFLLFLPFLFLRRQQRPSKHAVGGLAPFLAVTSLGETPEKKRPLSFWLFLLAYLGATAALVSAGGMNLQAVLLEDQSASVLRASIASPAGHRNHVVVGSATESIQQADLLQAIQRLPENSTVTVWTDLPSPHRLPQWIHWNNQAFLSQNEIRGVILSAQPMNASEWRVHWAKQGAVPARLQCGTWNSEVLVGAAGSTVVSVANIHDGIHLIFAKDFAETEGVGEYWALPEIRIQLPDGANSAWQAAALAAWPSAKLSSGPALMLQIDREREVMQAMTDSLSWSHEPAPEEVARLAQVIRASINAANPPRDAREYLAQAPIDASRFGFSATRDAGLPQVSLWAVLAVMLAAVCAALAWMKIPSEGEANYSEV